MNPEEREQEVLPARVRAGSTSPARTGAERLPGAPAAWSERDQREMWAAGRWFLHVVRHRWWYLLGTFVVAVVSTLGGMTTLGLDVPELFAKWFGGEEPSPLEIEYVLPPDSRYLPLDTLDGELPVGKAHLKIEYAADPQSHLAFLILRPDGSVGAWPKEELIERSYAMLTGEGRLRIAWVAESVGAESLFVLESPDSLEELADLRARIAGLELHPSIPPSVQIAWEGGRAEAVPCGRDVRDFADVRDYAGDAHRAWVDPLCEVFAELEGWNVSGRTYPVGDAR